MDPIYAHLGLKATDTRFTVLRAAVKALHPGLRRIRALRASRHRFYRAMLASHAALQKDSKGAD